MPQPLTESQLSFIIQFIHPEKIAGFLSPARDEFLAPVFDIDLATYQRIKKQFADNAKRVATELLADAAFASHVDRLPFSRGSTVVGLGDSITDDYQSWFEILRHLLAMRRPSDNIRLVNAGVSGDTTSQMIGRFLNVVNEKPEWIICFAGTNDARTHGLQPTKSMVSLEETKKNFDMLRNFAATQINNAKWAWITPGSANQDMINQHWFLGPMQLTFPNSGLAAIGDLVKQNREPVVDLQKLFGVPPKREWMLDDGLHPSLEGQRAIVRAVVEALSK